MNKFRKNFFSHSIKQLTLHIYKLLNKKNWFVFHYVFVVNFRCIKQSLPRLPRKRYPELSFQAVSPAEATHFRNVTRDNTRNAPKTEPQMRPSWKMSAKSWSESHLKRVKFEYFFPCREFHLTWLNIHVDSTFHLQPSETLIFNSHRNDRKFKLIWENKLSQLDNELAREIFSLVPRQQNRKQVDRSYLFEYSSLIIIKFFIP